MNILYLHAHDLGRCLPAYGFPGKAPQLERFQQQAGTVTFGNAHSLAPTCSPSRAALLSGQTPHESGMLGLMHRGFRLSHPWAHLAPYLRDHGFQTALTGIQHLQPGRDLEGYEYRDLPEKHRLPGGEVDWGRWDEEVAESAAIFVGRSEGPFFLDCGFWWPHRPFPKDGDPWQGNLPLDGLEDSPGARADLGAFDEAIRHLDGCCGRVLDALEASGRREETMIVFTTDHGPAFPGHKCRLTSRGTGVALMIQPPGSQPGPAPSRVEALVSHLDLFPTFVDYLDSPPPAWALRGESLRPLLEGDSSDGRREVFGEVTFHAGYEPMRSLRTPEHLLIRVFEQDLRPVPANIDDSACKEDWIEGGGLERMREKIELYDLKKDSRETRSVAHDPAYAGIRSDLEGRLEAWMRETDDPLLEGAVRPPAGAYVNDREHRSATIGEP